MKQKPPKNLNEMTLGQIHAAADKIISDHKGLIQKRLDAINKQKANYWAGVPVDWTEVESLMDPPPPGYGPPGMMAPPRFHPRSPDVSRDAEGDGGADLGSALEDEMHRRGWSGPIVVVRRLPPGIGIAPPPVAAPGEPAGPGPYGHNQEICGYCGKIKQKREWCWNIHCKSNQRRNGR